MAEPAKPRMRPCASCPYRRDAPSGLWHPDEYSKLPRYDEPTYAQPTAVFACHHDDGDVCAGWLAHADPTELLAVRIGLMNGSLDASCADYSTQVSLHPSGQAAADHGMLNVAQPGTDAIAAADKINRVHLMNARRSAS